MNIAHFFDSATSTLSYVVHGSTGCAVVFDPVLDFDPATFRISTSSIERLLSYIEQNRLHVKWIFDTHVHADHLSGTDELRRRTGAPIGINQKIVDVQKCFKSIFNLQLFVANGSQFDQLLNDDDTLVVDDLTIRVLHLPGHTPTCTGFLIGDTLFVGDAMFMPELGTGRCDFSGGSAQDQYRSIQQKVYTLPASTRIFVGHDYPKDGATPKFQTTVGEEKEKNIMLPASMHEDDFILRRQTRDKQLTLPKLYYYALQVNIAAGKLPEPEATGQRYLKIPLT